MEMSFLFGSTSSYPRVSLWLITRRIPGDLRTSRDAGSVAVSHAAGQKASHCTYLAIPDDDNDHVSAVFFSV
jgi:hypothetical protein